MSVDLRRMSREELDQMNREIARYKAARNPGEKRKPEVNPNSGSPQKRDTKGEQLELL